MKKELVALALLLLILAGNVWNQRRLETLTSGLETLAEEAYASARKGHWQEAAEAKTFLVRISLKGLDRMGLLNEISRFLSLVMGANMRRLNLSADNGIFEGYIDLYVNSKDVLEKILKKLTTIEGIESVSRIDL